eukprot:9504169-Pyramimonas_sp.AAC.2
MTPCEADAGWARCECRGSRMRASDERWKQVEREGGELEAGRAPAAAAAQSPAGACSCCRWWRRAAANRAAVYRTPPAPSE